MKDLDRKLRSLDTLARLRALEEIAEIERARERQRSIASIESEIRALRDRRAGLVEDALGAKGVRNRRFIAALIERERSFEVEVAALEAGRADQARRLERARMRSDVTARVRERHRSEHDTEVARCEERRLEDSRAGVPRPNPLEVGR